MPWIICRLVDEIVDVWNRVFGIFKRLLNLSCLIVANKLFLYVLFDRG